MKRATVPLALLSLLAGSSAVTAFAQEADADGCKDPALFNRMPGYRIQRCSEKDFDAHAMRVEGGKEKSVEGRKWELRYALQTGATEATRVQLIRNYQNAIERLGGERLFSDDEGNAYFRVEKDGKETWIHVSAYITSEWMLYVVEKKAMKQDIVANAEALAGDLKTSGHAAVYGIHFDTGKSEIKAGSESALAQIAKLLKKDPSLKLHVVGHTDGVGGLDSNMTLSTARAEAVVAALTAKHGIEASRLRASGVGPLAPVASNADEAGCARNRRVELVKQ